MKSFKWLTLLALFLGVLSEREASAHGTLDDFEVPPATLTTASRFYRGMNERQASLGKIFGILAGAQSPADLIPSRRWSTLRAWAPLLSDAEVTAWIERDLADYRERKILWAFASCHSDWYECWLPPFEDLLGKSFKTMQTAGLLLPDGTTRVAEAQNIYSGPSPDGALILFDPVISTSSSKRVARDFAREREPDFAAYVLTLKDSEHRHCTLERKTDRPASCFITQTEYAEELEYPFFGVIRPDEVVELERGATRVSRGPTPGSLTVSQGEAVIHVERPKSGVPCEPADEIPGLDLKVRHALAEGAWRCRAR